MSTEPVSVTTIPRIEICGGSHGAWARVWTARATVRSAVLASRGKGISDPQPPRRGSTPQRRARPDSPSTPIR